ncbi:MAG: NADH-quinone oxidoreductase subunit M [Nocardioidaceae bacterium]|nr:NADH-quinone oxidoreductase subunit M [Nocardioidaceae bacterium]
MEFLVAGPAVGAALLPLLRDSRRVTQAAIGLASAVLAVSIWMWVDVVSADGAYVWQSNASWIAALDVHWRLGVDDLSAPLVVLTALLTWCCLVALLKRAPDCGGTSALVGLILVIEAGSIGTFVALDLVLFFVLFEVVLIPMWFVIAAWGDPHDEPGRRRAASRFLVVTVTGSALMLVAFLLLRSELGTFDLAALTERARVIESDRQILIAVLLMVGFGAKIPMWPLHFWLPDAHSKAPTVGSVLLAGVLLKLGTYGLLRFWYDVVPVGALEVAPYLGALGVVGIVYGALACLAQPDLKRLIAYSSVGHMGFVALAISTMTPQGLAAANFANVAHGVITALLFFVVGAVKDRVGDSGFGVIGRGLYARSPHLAAVLAVAAVASLGLPGLAGFWGEMLTMLAAYSPHPDLPQTTYLVFMVLAGLGVVLTTVYFVVAVRKVCQGVPASDAVTDVEADEWVAWLPLVALTVLLGLAPMVMLWSADVVAALPVTP